MDGILGNDSSDEDSVALGLDIIIIVLYIAVMVWITLLIVKEIRSKFIDSLKIMQYLWVIIHFFANFITSIIESAENVNKFYIDLARDLFSFLMLYYILNQLAWYMLIVHLETYRLLAEDANYRDWKTIIKRNEWIFLILSIIVSTFWIGIRVLYDIFGIFSFQWTQLFITISLILRAIFEFLLAINEIYLFMKVKKVMSQNLNYYYNSYRNNLYALVIINVTYFLLWSMHNILDAIFEIGDKSTRDNKEWTKILYLIVRVLTFTYLLAYIIINSRNIKFKDWMIDVLSGYKLLRYYNEWSIFIKASELYTEDLDGLIDSITSTDKSKHSETLFTEVSIQEDTSQNEYKSKYEALRKSQLISGLNWK